MDIKGNNWEYCRVRGETILVIVIIKLSKRILYCTRGITIRLWMCVRLDKSCTDMVLSNFWLCSMPDSIVSYTITSWSKSYEILRDEDAFIFIFHWTKNVDRKIGQGSHLSAVQPGTACALPLNGAEMLACCKLSIWPSCLMLHDWPRIRIYD